MALLGETYFHLKNISLSEQKLKRFGDNYSDSLKKIAGIYLKENTIIELHFVDGSVKGWIKIIAPILFIYSFVADYKGFKEGINEMIADGQKFGQAAIDKMSKSPEIAGSKVFRTERRKKTPGKIKKLIEKKEYIDNNRKILNKMHVIQLEIEFEKQLNSLFVDLDENERILIRKLIGAQNDERAPPDQPRTLLQPRAKIQSELFGVDNTDNRERTIEYRNHFIID